MIRRFVINVFLFGCVLFFGVGTLRVIRSYDPLAPFAGREVKPPRSRNADRLDFEPTGAEDIAEHNPFHPDRGVPAPVEPPKPVVVKTPESTPEPLAALTLKGIVLDTDGDRIAVIEREGERPRLLREGDTQGDLTVLSIGNDRVTVSRQGKREVLNLRKMRTIDVEENGG